MATRPSAAKPEYQVIGTNLYVQTSDGEIVLPLRFKTKLFRQLAHGTDEMSAFFAILDNVGSPEVVEALDELDLAETSRHMERWWEEVHRRTREGDEADSLGNSESSST